MIWTVKYLHKCISESYPNLDDELFHFLQRKVENSHPIIVFLPDHKGELKMIGCGEQAPDLWNTEHLLHIPFQECQGVLETPISPKQIPFKSWLFKNYSYW